MVRFGLDHHNSANSLWAYIEPWCQVVRKIPQCQHISGWNTIGGPFTSEPFIKIDLINYFNHGPLKGLSWEFCDVQTGVRYTQTDRLTNTLLTIFRCVSNQATESQSDMHCQVRGYVAGPEKLAILGEQGPSRRRAEAERKTGDQCHFLDPCYKWSIYEICDL